MGKKAMLWLLVVLCSQLSPAGAGAPVVLRINTNHAIESAQGAVLDAGLSLSSEVRVTSSGEERGYLNPPRFIEDAKAAGATILSTSFSGWQSIWDSSLYQRLADNGMLHVYAYEPRTAQPANAPPPAVFTTVNLIGRSTGPGIEFGVPEGYQHGKGQGGTPSAATAQLAGLMASLKYLHPEWNWFDVKAALRATAANFPTGYNPGKYGYGAIDYTAANLLRDAKALPLFAPAAVVHPQKGDTLLFSMNAFRQTRRTADALFKFRSKPSTGTGEMSITEIQAMGGTLVYVGDPATSNNTLRYPVKGEETVYFVWFTRDAAGRFSRIEPYCILGPVHLAPQPLYGPRLPQSSSARRRGQPVSQRQ